MLKHYQMNKHSGQYLPDNVIDNALFSIYLRTQPSTNPFQFNCIIAIEQ